MVRAHGTTLAKPLNPSHFCAGPLATLNLSHLNSVLSELPSSLLSLVCV